jgi:hypothetical protein
MIMILLLVLSGCAPDSNESEPISRTGNDRVALFKEKVVSNVNPLFDDKAIQAVNKVKLDTVRPVRGANADVKQTSGPRYLWASGTCQEDTALVSKKYVDVYMLPEEGGIECLNVEISINFIACIRNSFEVAAPRFLPGVYFAFSLPEEDDSRTLKMSHATITIREEQSLERIDVTITFCPDDASLDVCIFDYSPVEFIRGGAYNSPSTHKLQPLSSSEANASDLIGKAIDKMVPVKSRVLGILVRRVELTADRNSCPQAQLYSNN